MIRNYIKIAWRNIIHSKSSSAINIGGLAVGMTVAILISLWIYNELSFNKIDYCLFSHFCAFISKYKVDKI